MTSSNQQNFLSDTWRDQCLLYLFGELGASQVINFERELASSPELSDELARQAESICLLAPAAEQTELSERIVKTSTNWKVVAILATAASILFAILLLRPSETGRVANQDSRPVGISDDLLIAQAWLNNHHSVVVEPDENELADWVPIESTTDFESNLDSTLSWMFAAVSTSDVEDTDRGVGNDG